LDEGLALSGRKFGATYKIPVKQPGKLDEQEIASLANGVALFRLNPAQPASQAV
jgi:hypothetical protein